MSCDFCLADTETTGAILNGTYGQACRQCRTKAKRISSGLNAQWLRDRDREDNQRDLLQPWINGKINVEFARNYPEQAKEMYTKEELKEV
jgi:hypothetical protein